MNGSRRCLLTLQLARNLLVIIVRTSRCCGLQEQRLRLSLLSLSEDPLLHCQRLQLFRETFTEVSWSVNCVSVTVLPVNVATKNCMSSQAQNKMQRAFLSGRSNPTIVLARSILRSCVGQTLGSGNGPADALCRAQALCIVSIVVVATVNSPSVVVMVISQLDATVLTSVDSSVAAVFPLRW